MRVSISATLAAADPSPAPVGRLWMQLRLALPALVFAAVVYYPVTQSYFYLDDFLNLYHIVNDSLLQYLVRENGGHILLTRNTFFYVTFLLAGPNPELFYWSAFVTHLFNVFLLFLIVVRLTDRPALASFGAAFWGISPLNEGALGWYSVYGHALVGTAMLIILAQASRCVAEQRPPSAALRRFWYVLALMAATSFGTGVGIAMVMPFALWLLLYPLVRRPPLLSLVVVVPALYVGLTRMFEYTSNAEAPARSIVSNLFSSLAAMWSMFIRVTGFGIAEWATGFVLPTPAPLQGWITSLLVATSVVLVAMVLSRPPVRRQLAACTLLVVAAYGIISMGRGALMANAADELIERLTRYQYTGPIALTIILCLVLAPLGRVIDRRVGMVALAIWYVVAAVRYSQSNFVIEQHQTERDQTAVVLSDIRAAIAAAAPGETVRLKNAVFPPFPLGSYVPGYAAAFTMFYPDNIVEGRRVEFIETAPHIIEGHQHGRRIGPLLVAP